MKAYTIQTNPDESLLQSLTRLGVFPGGVCGGTGKCGKCTVRLLAGTIPPSAGDRKNFSDEQLRDGFRLACTAYPQGEVTVAVGPAPEIQNIQTAFFQKAHTDQKDTIYKVAIDIGTTTIAMTLLHGSAEQAVAGVSARNSQFLFGGDVISRISAAVNGKAEVLQDAVRTDCLQGIRKLCGIAHIPTDAVKEAFIAANTVMTQLLLGVDCSPLASAPFAPFLREFVQTDFYSVFHSDLCPACSVSVFPAIAAFVGGDSTAGLYSLQFARSEAVHAFIDLGTNGEIAVGNRDGICVCSTAAGPAFEGGCIRCGTGSVTGAIERVRIRDGKTEISTIGHTPAVGLCGTGIVELTAELLDAGFADESGTLCEPFFSQGYPLSPRIRFTQEDIRQVQLAKAAVCAGLQTLLHHMDLPYDSIEKLYIAGGFGTKLDICKAGRIGLLPAPLTEKAVAVGNSALGGAVNALFDSQSYEICREIQRISTCIPLASDAYFSDRFIENMMF